MRPPMRQGSPDAFQTLPEALQSLLPYLDLRWTIWECACGKGWLVGALNDANFYDVIATDIETGRDFLSWLPEEHWDAIVTNPPYSIKDKFIERCYELGKPWALLLPLTSLEGRRRQLLFDRHGIELVIPRSRINFHTPSGKGSGSWFMSAWFTWGLKIGKTLTFEQGPVALQQEVLL